MQKITTKPPIFEELINHQYPIEALVIKNKSTQSRTMKQLKIIQIANQHKIPIILVENSSQLIDALKPIKSKIAIVASFSIIIPLKIINKFPLGMINVHPSLLPKYRGPTPIESTLLYNDSTAGVSLIKLNKDLDAGNIYIQQQIDVPETMNKLELTEELSQLAAKLLITNLNKIINKKNNSKTSRP